MLINCVAYQEGKKLCSIPVEEISDYVKKPDCFVWVALKNVVMLHISLSLTRIAKAHLRCNTNFAEVED